MFFFFKQKTAYEIGQLLEFRRVLFRSVPSARSFIYRKERADGTGDVVMAVQQSTSNFNNRRNQTTEEIGFMGISNPQEVEKMLRQLAEDD